MTEPYALLLTDVVDSTQLSEQIGDAAMAEVWAAHDRAARDLLPRWRGREIDKTDGMLLLFVDAMDAVAYALAYHDANSALPRPLRARAGLHVGPVILRENPAEDVARGAKPLEVDGLAKPTAARVMSLARGGQTLLTAEARAALGTLPEGLQIESHGHWQVKGMAEPIELFEVAPRGRRCVAPPDSEKVFRVLRAADWWMPVRDIPNNLPFQASSFVGRERELSELGPLLARTRLLTLLGMGGLGKTRLSLQLAAEALPKFSDGVWFIDLSPLREGALLVSEAAQAIGVDEQPGQPLLATVCARLKPQHSLLIIDNCEHMMEAAAAFTAAVLRAAPHVRIIATSREALHVPGEQSYPILPLPLPARGDTPAQMARSTAVQLFVARARAQKPGFMLDEREAPAVAELVARLEGIPLALELAAARVRSMSVAEINQRLQHRFKILTGGARTAQERQQTLRGLVDWSYGLLNTTEQHLLDHLSLFVGGFDLVAAEQVCSDDELLARDDVIDVLRSLIEKSLVTAIDADAGTRYTMLETIREYASEKLDHSGKRPAGAVRHVQHYFELAKKGNHGLNGADHALWVDRLEAEIDNLRAALTLALTGGVDPFIAVKICVALLGFWIQRGYVTEGRVAVRASLELPAVRAADLARAHALYVGAGLATAQSDNEQARQMLEECLALRRGLGQPVDVAATLSTLSLARLNADDAAGARRNELEALALFRSVDDRRGEAIGLLHLGQIDAHEESHAAAREHLLESLRIARDIALVEAEAECELTLGQIAAADRDLPTAGTHLARSLALCNRAGDRRGQANALWFLARLDLRRDEPGPAREHLAQAITLFNQFKMQAELLGALEDRSVLAVREGDPALALRLAGATIATRARAHLVRSPRDEREWQRHLEGLLPPSMPATHAPAEPSTWTIEQAIAAALQPAAPDAPPP